ncbi:MAG: ATP-dependent DNA helicase RecG [Oscillospiraceae bacterium]|nr:ATP-dependent DNA helicase RecG [Oscillospiraceae bacterium]
MDELDSLNVRYIKGVGEARAKSFEKLGVRTLRDLVSYFPRTYEDRTVFKDIGSLIVGENACVCAVVATQPRLSHIRKGMDLLKFKAVDGADSLDVTFFNQPYKRDSIHIGETYVFYGRVGGRIGRPEMVNPVMEREQDSGRTTGRIMPIYRLTSGLTQNFVAKAVRSGLDACREQYPDILPARVREESNLCSAGFAYENVHFPKDTGSLEIARRRLVFEELFALSAAMRLMRGRRMEQSGIMLPECDMGPFFRSLPFELTGAQRRAVDEAVSDMTKGERPMSRLLQGDVGSGKTVVAAACCYAAWRAGRQSAFMAPTEILADQHLRSLTSMLGALGMNVDILKGSMTAKQKREARARLSSGETDLVIGTHALISEDVEFSDLALVITDEQHRFGVDQRSELTKKGDRPHVLVMSATPIPRTLALIIYGDLDVSIIDELPPGRQKVDTFAVGEDMRERINNFIRKLVAEGRQVYIVCPMVGEADTEQAPDAPENLKAAEEYAKKLRDEVFPDLRVAIIHGKMKPLAKDETMKAFAAGESDILVATTVIEVGVDVPNAALMVVENADRFGLSQLHQLRGRVGRGKHKSYCVLFEGSGGDTAKERLKVMCETNDGFKIAEEDLRLRGPGDFFGSRQHGLPEMHIADIAGDMDVLKQAQEAAKRVLEEDPELTDPENSKLSQHVERMFSGLASRLN